VKVAADNVLVELIWAEYAVPVTPIGLVKVVVFEMDLVVEILSLCTALVNVITPDPVEVLKVPPVATQLCV